MATDLVVKQERPAELVREEAITPMGILQMAISQNADIDKLTKLMELQERWEANEARKQFNAAMAKFKENPPKISKNKHVRFQTSKGVTEYDHSTLDHVCDQIIAALSAVGISHRWEPTQQGATISIACILTHVMGHSERTTLSSGPDESGGKNAIQAISSAVTYLQRYTLLSATGVASGMDDDGKAAGTKPGKDMEPDEFDRLCGLLENAGSIESLKSTYMAACSDAKELGDKAAIQSFAKIKDSRYKELHNANR